MPIDGGDGLATVKLSKAELAVATKLATRTQSDPGTDPETGVDLGAGAGAGRTSNTDNGAATDIKDAVAMAKSM